jgi:hypothetical protein
LPPPQIRLLGSTRVEVLQGATYQRCTVDTPLTLQCDPGADAWDPIEGSLTQFVHACKEGFTFWSYGLQECGLNTDTPGVYTISFWVQDSATNETSAVTRTVHVLEQCKGDESRCSDGNCSVGPLCEGSNVPAGLGNMMPPGLELLRIPGQNSTSVVAIPFGWAYKACGPSSSPSLASTPCDSGLLSCRPLCCCI